MTSETNPKTETATAAACSDGLPGDKGSKMLCNKCLTEWWTKLAGNRCPNCDSKYERLKSTIQLTLETKRDEMRERRAKIEALEEMDAMCGRLDSGM